MFSAEEKRFIDYWTVQRVKKKKSLRQLMIGLPVGLMIILPFFLSIVSGWHKKAEMIYRANSSIIMIILIAAVAIIVFITLFSAYHQWDQHEQRYRELIERTNDSGAAIQNN